MGARSLKARSHLGHTARKYGADAVRLDEARRELAAAKIADYIEQVVSSAPPLTAEQRDRLALLLHGGDAA